MSDSDDDNPIRYGTPLEPYEEDEIPSKRKYQEPTDQYAVDSHGRRRFHGAFTGGFSAGFGNTVGSQEGWTPATFKSSRSEKAQSSSQRPEDFMDEEDRSEFGIAPKQVETHNEFSGRKRSRQTFHDGPIPGEPVLEQFIRAVHETAAVRMLREMGWRPGQGAGGRLTRKEKSEARERQRVYGCYIPEELRQSTQTEEQDSESSDSEFEYDTLFAPDDYEPYILNRKNDRFGLGYQGLSRHSVLGNLPEQRSHLKMTDKGKKVSIRGQAFGVGAFEADDDDIYATEDMSHYDTAIGGPERPPKQGKRNDNAANALCGFVRASKPLPAVAQHPPCALPRDYAPAAAGARRTRFDTAAATPRDQGLGRHELTAAARGALLGETSQNKATNEELIAKITGRNVNFVSSNQESQRDASNSASRTVGEITDLTKPNSRTVDKIIDLTTPNSGTVDKIIDLTTPNSGTVDKIIDFTTPNSRTVDKIIDFTAPISDTPDFISIKDSGKELTKVFKPFASNPLKQKRYENYLKNKDSSLERDGSIDRLTEWERDRELMEFEQAAKLYKPLTGIMGDRFTHATEPDDATNPLAIVTKSRVNYGLATAEQIAAAERGVYGVMTRIQTAWSPHGIVCKRFNVPEPGVASMEPKKDDKPKVSYSIFSYLESSVHDKDSFAKEQTKFSGSKSISDIPKPVPKTPIVTQTDNNPVKNNEIRTVAEETGFSKRMTVAELFLKESEKSKETGEEVTDTIDKFDKMDLYKSIFLSDSEDDDVSKDDSDKTADKIPTNEFNEAPKNVERNTSPPRGIFANIDFDELNSWRRDDSKSESSKDKSTDPSSNTVKPTATSNQNEMETEETYGPKIPETLLKRLESKEEIESNESKRDVVEIDSSSADSWVDVNEVKSKKKEKKKKSKHKKHKSKHKKTKHKKDK